MIWGASKGIRGFEIEFPFKMAEENKGIVLPKIYFDDLKCFSGDVLDYKELDLISI